MNPHRIIHTILGTLLQHPLGEAHTHTFDSHAGIIPVVRECPTPFGLREFYGHILYCRCGAWQFYKSHRTDLRDLRSCESAHQKRKITIATPGEDHGKLHREAR